MNRRGTSDPSAPAIQIREERRFNWFLPTAVVFAGLLALEVLLRVFLPPPSGCFIHRPHLVRSFTPLPDVMPGVLGKSEFRVNSLGVRGSEPPPGKPRGILALGGSSTECLYLDQGEAWPALLEKVLNDDSPGSMVWVANAGKTGVSSREHRLQVPILLSDLPNIDVMILMAGVNDLLLRLALTENYDPDFVVKPGSREFLLHRAFDTVPSATEMAGVSLLPRRTLEVIIGSFRTALGFKKPAVSTHLVEDRAGMMYIQRRDHRRNRIGTREEIPDLSTGLREYEKNLLDCLKAAKTKEVRVILVSQPVLWEEGLPEHLESLLWTGGIGSISGEGLEYYSTAALAEGMRRYNDRMRELAEAESVEFFDLAARLPRDDSVFYDDCHLNESGAVQVAALLKEAVVSEEAE